MKTTHASFAKVSLCGEVLGVYAHEYPPVSRAPVILGMLVYDDWHISFVAGLNGGRTRHRWPFGDGTSPRSQVLPQSGGARVKPRSRTITKSTLPTRTAVWARYDQVWCLSYMSRKAEIISHYFASKSRNGGHTVIFDACDTNHLWRATGPRLGHAPPLTSLSHLAGTQITLAQTKTLYLHPGIIGKLSVGSAFSGITLSTVISFGIGDYVHHG
jgi:hypothetical protein